MAGGLEQKVALATDASGNVIQGILGTYGPNKDAGHPDTDGAAKSWTVKFTNTASTVTVITGTNSTPSTFVLKTGEVYEMDVVGAVITDKAFLQLGFGETADPDSGVFATLPSSVAGTNGVTNWCWSCRAPVRFKVLPGQKFFAVKVGPDAFASPATGGPWLCIRKLS